MKDSEFIELLNLYLDHEISAADAARLEAEVQSNQARRRIYQQYCRMQKACKILASDFQAENETSVAASDRKVIAFNPSVTAQRQRSGRFYTVGTFAALAACVAIIFVGRSRQQPATLPEQATTAVADTAPAPIANPNATFVASSTAAPRGLVSVAPRTPTVLVRDPLLLTGTQAEAVYNAAVQQANNQLAWIDGVQLSPLQQRVPTNDLHFAATLRTEARPLGNRTTTPMKQTEAGEEWVGFKYAK